MCCIATTVLKTGDFVLKRKRRSDKIKKSISDNEISDLISSTYHINNYFPFVHFVDSQVTEFKPAENLKAATARKIVA